MFLKLLADNFNPFKGHSIVQLQDAEGIFFPAQILSLAKVNLALLPQDDVAYKLFDLKEDLTPLCKRKYYTRFFNIKNYFDSYYVITNIPAKNSTPNIVFGYAGFEMNYSEQCLDLISLYSSKNYEADEKYKTKLFGINMVAFGLHLNRKIFGNKSQKILNVPTIDQRATNFYNKLKFERYGPYKSEGFLTKEIAEILFN